MKDKPGAPVRLGLAAGLGADRSRENMLGASPAPRRLIAAQRLGFNQRAMNRGGCAVIAARNPVSRPPERK
jgi:hypothetical protein